MDGAGREDELLGTLLDLRYLVKKYVLYGNASMVADLDYGVNRFPDDQKLKILTQSFRDIAPLLSFCKTTDEIYNFINTRFCNNKYLTALLTNLDLDWSLIPEHRLPDQHPQHYIQTLVDTSQQLTGDQATRCLLSQTGNFMVCSFGKDHDQSFQYKISVWEKTFFQSGERFRPYNLMKNIDGVKDWFDSYIIRKDNNSHSNNIFLVNGLTPFGISSSGSFILLNQGDYALIWHLYPTNKILKNFWPL